MHEHGPEDPVYMTMIRSADMAECLAQCTALVQLQDLHVARLLMWYPQLGKILSPAVVQELEPLKELVRQT